MIIDTFSLDLAKSLVDGAIKAKGEDFVYEKVFGNDCLYVHEGEAWDDESEDYVSSGEVQPGCVWGHALSAANVPLEEFGSVEGTSVQEVLERFRKRGLVGTVEPLAAAWAYIVQYEQDSGRTWGEARDYANLLLEESKKRTLRDEDRADWMRNQV